MTPRPTLGTILATSLVVCLVALSALPAIAAPSAAQISADSARVDAAVQKLQAARQRSDAIGAQEKRTSAKLDAVVADQQRARARLRSRAVTMYRSGDFGFIQVLLGASTFEEFAARWDLLTRMNGQDAADLRELQVARVQAERSAKSLMNLQAEQAQAVDAQAAELASARKDLASSRTALSEFEARTAQRAKAVATAKKGDSKAKSGGTATGDSSQGLSGSGAWTTSVASHYGLNFHGRGASGETIGPYSMMVAHETLPFGTIIEFEYNGKHAVAHVADRGPYSSGRTFDLGPGVIRVLGFRGVHPIRWRIIK